MPEQMTPEQAARQRYGRNGVVAYDPLQCVAAILPADGWSTHQCQRKPGHGPHGLYCRQHAKRFDPPLDNR